MNSDHARLFYSVTARITHTGLREACLQLQHYPEFWTWPAAISHHHAYETGLIQHTLEVAMTALRIADGFPDCNLSVLLTAALWHDWGKIREYVEVEAYAARDAKTRHLLRAGETKAWVFNANASTHIATSAIEFSKHCDNPAVVHGILAHHGPVREWGSPEAPRTLEALILHQADVLSASYGAAR